MTQHDLFCFSLLYSLQSLWRRRAAMKLYKPLLHRIKLAKERKRVNAAVTIQSAWRCFVVYSTYMIKRYENKAATSIQAHWRGYWQATNYLILCGEVSCSISCYKCIKMGYSVVLYLTPLTPIPTTSTGRKDPGSGQRPPRKVLAGLPK